MKPPLLVTHVPKSVGASKRGAANVPIAKSAPSLNPSARQTAKPITELSAAFTNPSVNIDTVMQEQNRTSHQVRHFRQWLFLDLNIDPPNATLPLPETLEADS
jgi:hypothetical protein